MKKKSFLLPLSVAIASLTTFNSSAISKSLDVDVEQKLQIEKFKNDLPLNLEPSKNKDILANHRSHYSHYSHRSHYSHYSSSY